MSENSVKFRFGRLAEASLCTVVSCARSRALALLAGGLLLGLFCPSAQAASLSLICEEVNEIKLLGAIQDTKEKSAPQTHAVSIEGLGFSPRVLLARAGDEIALENHSLYALTMTLDRGGKNPSVLFNGRLDAQKDIRIPLKEAGEYTLNSAEFSSLTLPIRVLPNTQKAWTIALDATGRGHVPLPAGKARLILFTSEFHTTNTIDIPDDDKTLSEHLSFANDGSWRLEAPKAEKPGTQAPEPEPAVKAAPATAKPEAAKPAPPKPAPKAAAKPAVPEKAKHEAPKPAPKAEQKKEEKPAPKTDAPKTAPKPGSFNLKVIED